MHRDFLPCIDAHCQCTRFLFLLAKEVQDQRRSWECQTKFWCIVPSFKTLSSLRFRIISEFSWKHWSVGQSCVLPLSYQGFSWWQRLTQWAKKKGVTDVSQAHNQSKPRQWAEIQVGGTRALSRTQYFFDTCPLLCKFVQDCFKDPEHNLEYLMLSCYVAQMPKLEFESPPWQEHVCECVEVSIWVQAIPNDWVGDTPGTHLAEPGSPYLGGKRRIIPIQQLSRAPAYDRSTGVIEVIRRLNWKFRFWNSIYINYTGNAVAIMFLSIYIFIKSSDWLHCPCLESQPLDKKQDKCIGWPSPIFNKLWKLHPFILIAWANYRWEIVSDC